MDPTAFPLVSIGIPAYNEAEYLAAALDNLLAQTHPNIEIIISDNASTDATGEISADYARRFPRITHVRHATNLGQHGNFNYLPRVARGEFFVWAAGHDLLEKTFIADAVSALQKNPSAVLAFPRTIDVRPDGTPFNENARSFDIEHKRAPERFIETMWRVDCNYVYGVYRRVPMLTTRLFQAIPAPDRVFLAEMSARGPFVPANTIRYCRMNRGTKQTEVEKRHRLLRYIDPDRRCTDAELMRNSFYTPTIVGYRRAVYEGGFSPLQRLRILFSVWLCGVLKFHLFPGADMLSTLAKAVLPQNVLRRVLARMQ